MDAEPGAGGGWRGHVADNGIGMEPAYVERVFGFGERCTREDAIAGTGIGLAVCTTVVERHGGRISVNPHRAAAARFRFTLPAARR